MWNKEKRIQGSSDIELTEYGIELAEKTRDGFVAQGISFDKIMTSPLVRARMTAEIINQAYNVPLEVYPELKEMCFGEYEGLNLPENVEKYENMKYLFSQPEKYRSEANGESFEALIHRISSFCEKRVYTLEQYCDSVLIVCHGAIIRALLSYIKGNSLKDFWKISQPNCSVNIIDYTNGRAVIEQETLTYYEYDKNSYRGIL